MEYRWKVKERARTYISRMPESLQGQGGSQAMFNVAAVLMRGFSLDEADGMELLAEWNEHHAHPRWSPVELRHKIRDGAKADRPEGYLLRERHHTRSHQTSSVGKELSKERRLQSLTSVHTPEVLSACDAALPAQDPRQLKQPLV